MILLRIDNSKVVLQVLKLMILEISEKLSSRIIKLKSIRSIKTGSRDGGMIQLYNLKVHESKSVVVFL